MLHQRWTYTRCGLRCTGKLRPNRCVGSRCLYPFWDCRVAPLSRLGHRQTGGQTGHTIIELGNVCCLSLVFGPIHIDFNRGCWSFIKIVSLLSTKTRVEALSNCQQVYFAFRWVYGGNSTFSLCVYLSKISIKILILFKRITEQQYPLSWLR